jgi:16S rRNA (cytosine1407-C5)-methyltransferase
MSSSSGIPVSFLQRLASIIPAEDISSVCDSFGAEDLLSVRINTLKSDIRTACDDLAGRGFNMRPLPAVAGAFILENGDRQGFSDLRIVREGLVYQQSAASLLPAVILDPKPGEMVLDACAAPGSKTSQMSSLMAGEGEIIAVEAVRGRYYKLRSVCELLGAKNVRFKQVDARRLHFERPCFDKVLVDVPCSSEGRFKTFHPKSYAYWSERKIKEMSHKQKGILLNSARALKVGGRLVYSTCTFSPEENEEVVDWFLSKTQGIFRLLAVDVPGVKCYPSLRAWKKREYKNDLTACRRILPDRVFSGFFIACMRREN